MSATNTKILEPETLPDHVLEAGTAKFLNGLSGPPIYTLSPEAARGVLSNVQSKADVALADVAADDRVLLVGPTGRTKVRIVRPMNATTTLPVIIYTHGGGWVLGDVGTHDRLIRELAVGSNAAVVFVDYERSPEARFPTAVEQAYAVTKYVANNAPELDVDPARLVIAGDSVGGNMTAVIAMMAKDRGGPAIAAQLLLYPVTDAAMSSASYREFADGPWLTRKAMEWYWDQYLPDRMARKDRYVSPLNASLEQLRGLPRTLLLVDENDVLRDEGEAYGRKLTQAGVRVASIRYNGTIHDFMMLNAITLTPPVRAAITGTIEFLRNVFVVS